MTSDLENDTVPTQAGARGLTVSVADAVLADEPVIVAVVADETVEVEIGKVAAVCPDGIVTETGTVAAGLLFDKPIGTPPVDAGAASVIVPVAPWPLVTVDGETEKLAMTPVLLPVVAGLTVSIAETTLAEEPVIVAVVGVETGDVETGKVAMICPAGTVMEAGVVMAELLLDKATCAPPAGADETSVKTPVAL
jgi:hypothetical protein